MSFLLNQGQNLKLFSSHIQPLRAQALFILNNLWLLTICSETAGLHVDSSFQKAQPSVISLLSCGTNSYDSK